MSQNNEIAILDFGSQYTHLIARRVRELGVASHIYPNDVLISKLKDAVGIILSGGPRSVAREPILPYNPKLFQAPVPILGLCYGHQLMAHVLKGMVGSGLSREYGLAEMNIVASPLFKKISKTTSVWMSHGDHVAALPPGFKQIASTDNGSITAMADEINHRYGLQFHPEVTHSKEGKKMLRNFIFGICKAKKNWSTGKMLTEIETKIKIEAGNKNVFLLVSGGVDSTVCFALLEKILGKNRVYGLHIDNGFMRLNETKKITVALKKLGYDNLHIHNAEKKFISTLKGVSEPEQKRKIIGNLFLDITERIMKEKGLSGDAWLLGQGTIYPDTIESGGTKNADVIKTHHNRVPRIQQMIAEGKIIEPIKELYKDEVRAIGIKLGLPKPLVFRHPFPGPGLAIRCLCSEGLSETVTAIQPPPNPLLRKEGAADLPLRPRAAFSFSGGARGGTGGFRLLKLPIKSVGVQGDERSYAHPAVIVPNRPHPLSLSSRRGQPVDVAFAIPSPRGEGQRVRSGHWLNWQSIQSLSPTITNTHKDINRVLLLVSGDQQQLMGARVHQTYLTKKRLDLLRKIDDIINTAITTNKKCQKIWQLPTVLVPFGHKHNESVVLRPVESEEAMTVSFGKIPFDTLQKIIKKINTLKAIDFIFYDLTNKPPGTIEWE